MQVIFCICIYGSHLHLPHNQQLNQKQVAWKERRRRRRSSSHINERWNVWLSWVVVSDWCNLTTMWTSGHQLSWVVFRVCYSWIQPQTHSHLLCCISNHPVTHWVSRLKLNVYTLHIRATVSEDLSHGQVRLVETAHGKAMTKARITERAKNKLTRLSQVNHTLSQWKMRDERRRKRKHRMASGSEAEEKAKLRESKTALWEGLFCRSLYYRGKERDTWTTRRSEVLTEDWLGLILNTPQLNFVLTKQSATKKRKPKLRGEASRAKCKGQFTYKQATEKTEPFSNGTWRNNWSPTTRAKCKLSQVSRVTTTNKVRAQDEKEWADEMRSPRVKHFHVSYLLTLVRSGPSEQFANSQLGWIGLD